MVCQAGSWHLATEQVPWELWEAPLGTLLLGKVGHQAAVSLPEDLVQSGQVAVGEAQANGAWLEFGASRSFLGPEEEEACLEPF